MATPEGKIQSEILKYLEQRWDVFCWRNNSTGVWDPIRKVYRKPSSKHCIRGVSDILGIYRPTGQLIAIEVKSRVGTVTPHQSVFLDEIRRSKGFAIVARSVKDVETALPKLHPTCESCDRE